jgi:PPOX class probable F420-dependent enzyme
MDLTSGQCLERLGAADHGVLATTHAERGPHAVPVCFAVRGDRVVVPVDRIKPKSSVDLQRVRNLDGEPRGALLCEHWDPDDWSQLWWVRASLHRIGGRADAGADGADGPDRAVLEDLLVRKYPPYRDRPFAGLLVFRVTALVGWSASEPGRAGV